MTRAMIVGDVHGRFEDFSNLIKKESPDLVIQVGDFGYWPSFVGSDVLRNNTEWDMKIDNGDTKIYFCEGNHEELPKLYEAENPVLPNVYFLKRNTILEVNGVNILFMGGAESIDKNLRTPGHDWFSEESITQKDIYELPPEDVQIVISHCAPMQFYLEDIDSSPSRQALSYILSTKYPNKWFFGHYHRSCEGMFRNTHWVCLNMVPEEKCYRILNL